MLKNQIYDLHFQATGDEIQLQLIVAGSGHARHHRHSHQHLGQHRHQDIPHLLRALHKDLPLHLVPDQGIDSILLSLPIQRVVFRISRCPGVYT